MSLPDLSKAVADQFACIVESGAITAMIEKHLTKTIDTILEDQLRSYSDFGTSLKEAVAQALQIGDVERLPNYGHFVSSIIAKNVDHQLHGAWAQKLQADIAAMFIEPPAEITLEELVEKFKENVRQRACGELDDVITLHVEPTSGSYWYVAMDKESGKPKYRCGIRFQVNDKGEIFALSLDDEDMKKTMFVGPFTEFERLLFRIYVQGTKVRIPDETDRHDFDLSLRNDD